MGSSFTFDIESDGLLRKEKPEHTVITKIHSLVLKDHATGAVLSYADQPGYVPINVGLMELADADLIVGHNIIRYDLKAIQRIYPAWTTKAKIRDTYVAASLAWPEDILKQKDLKLFNARKLPGELIGRQSLEAWGYRIANRKGEFEGPWEQWTPEMQTYCEQDVDLTDDLRRRIDAKGLSEMALEIEHELQEIIFHQEWHGACFDERAAGTLYAELVQRKLELERELQSVFPPFYLPHGKPMVPKRDNKKMHYTAGATLQHIKLTTFQPGSRDHIANRLTKRRGWKPKEFGSDGRPTVDEKTLAGLPYPEIPLLMRYLTVQKRIGQLAEGKEALMKAVRDGRIHGIVEINKAVTGRASHRKPNLAQVPKVQKSKAKGILHGEAGGWGWEFRSLFVAPLGWKQVGADASGLELRMLGHYLARWDFGAYAKEVVEGDVHSITMNALGIESRDVSKTWMYAWLYGAGDEKLGTILGYSAGPRAKAAGRAARSKFLKNLKAIGFLVDAVKAKAKNPGFLIGLDRRSLKIRSEHAALNTLLQSAGALVCKLWLVLLHRKLRESGFELGRDYVQALWVHDEVQLYTRPDIADQIGLIAVEAVREAGRVFGLRVPLDGEYKVGSSWAETH